MPQLIAAKQARVIFVSSGGMYSQKLNLSNIQSVQSPYRGMTAYANTKRAQVILAEIFSERYSSKNIIFNSLHPGWVNTPGVKKSLPGFWKWMKNRLRRPAEGADTTIWLAACEKIQDQTGKFWFDVSPNGTTGDSYDFTYNSRIGLVVDRPPFSHYIY
jgi:NAD(P)-dependent dehydrogenase (short-subunit alcohol dehydrogenase family)